MKLWKMLYSSGSSIGVAVVRAETRDRALELARSFASVEGLNVDWISAATVVECHENEGVLAWGES